MLKIQHAQIFLMLMSINVLPSEFGQVIYDDNEIIVSHIKDFQRTINYVNQAPATLDSKRDIMVMLPDLQALDCWHIPVDVKPETIQGSPLEVVVPYVLRKLGICKNMQRRVHFENIDNAPELMLLETGFAGDACYHQWIKQGQMLMYTCWRNGEIKTRKGLAYQCRYGRILCERDVRDCLPTFKEFQEELEDLRETELYHLSSKIF